METESGGERPPAMTDVARAAAVSHQTVSRVLNGHPNVRPETRARVFAAIEKLGYQPNLAARTLASGRSTQLGLVTLNTMLLGPVATLYAVEQAARAAGYSVSVTSVHSIDRSSLSDSLTRLVQRSVAGVIIIAPVASRDSALDALPPELPAVVVEADPLHDISAVTVDQRKGARLATRHLLDLGHRTVVHIAGPKDWIEAQERVIGWRSALEEAGAEIPQMISGDWSAQSGYDAGRVLVNAREVTAVFAANDNMALGLFRALSEHGRSVPGDVSVVGFDDNPGAGFFTPPLTSVRQDFAEMGRRSVELLLRQVKDDTRRVEHITLTPELVLRESTAPPPGCSTDIGGGSPGPSRAMRARFLLRRVFSRRLGRRRRAPSLAPSPRRPVARAGRNARVA
jgi:DNA-binding LacI/PurR family transcriptional regulator